MTDIHGSPGDAPQMPQASTPGAAPVPYAGPGQRPEPPGYGVELGPVVDAGAQVMSPLPPGNSVIESAGAHDIAAGPAGAPYYPGPLSPIGAAGDADAGGRDDVAGDVATAVANATARWHEHMSGLRAGGTIGDLITFPPSPLDPGAGVGNTAPLAAFYDPDRDYGGAQGAPGYQGKAI